MMTETPQWDVFISHASEDKDEIARPLFNTLKQYGLKVWLDEHELTLGDRLRKKIDIGLANSRFGVVILSRSFFEKDWPQKELDALVGREKVESKVILPIWHNVTKDEVAKFSPILASRIAVSSDIGIDKMAHAILKAIKVSQFSSTEIEKQAVLNNVPKLPKNFVPRKEDLERIKSELFDSGKGVTLASEGKIGVQGMGGIGKSVLASVISRDEDIRRTFHDGILWITIGQTPGDLTPQQAQIAEFFSGHSEHFENLQHGRSVLQERLRNKACLLILDDVWDVAHARPFDVLGDKSRILITTRQKSVLDRFGAKGIILNVLSLSQSLEFLAAWAGKTLEDLPRVARDIARKCGFLPLALAMVGAMVKCDEEAWSNVLQKLRNADLQRLRTQFPDYPYENLLAALQVSVEALDDLTRQRYLDLSVFPQDLEIPSAAIAVLWNIELIDADEVLNELADRSLLFRQNSGRVTLHDLQGDYLRKVSGDPERIHKRLISNYKTLCKTDWHSGPNDGYYFERLPLHFKEAGDWNKLKKILLDPQWLYTKLQNTGPYSLVRDYRLLDKNKTLSLIGNAIALASNSLSENVKLFPTELWGRLINREEAEISKFLKDTTKVINEPWLRPIIQNLSGPGGPLISTLYGHSGTVTSVCCTSDGKTLVSGGSDGDINLWSVDSGELLKTLRQHDNSITNVTITPDDEFILSASQDGLIIVWDRRSGNIERTLQKHNAKVTALTVSPDGKNAISASEDQTVIVWNIDSGKDILTFKDHSAPVTAIAVTPNNKFVISASLDNFIKIWSIETGLTIKAVESKSRAYVTTMAVTPDNATLIYGSKDGHLYILNIKTSEESLKFSEHQAPVTSLAIFRDGSQVISGASDKTIRLWDTDSGNQYKLFGGHQASVTGVATIPMADTFVSASDDKTLKIWALNAESSIRESHHNARVSHVAASTKYGFAVTASTDRKIKIWNANSGTKLNTIEFGTFIDVLKIVNNGEEIVVLPKQPHHGNIYFWRIDDTEKRKTVNFHRSQIPKEITTDGRTLFSTCRGGFVISDIPSGEVLMQIWGEREPNTVAFSSSGFNFAIATNNGISIWSTRLKSRKNHISGETNVTKLAASPVEELFLTASKNGILSIWDFETGNNLGSIEAHSQQIQDIAFTPDGQQIASASLDKTLKVWDMKSLSLVSSFQAEERLISCAAITELNYVAGDRGGNLHFLKLEKG